MRVAFLGSQDIGKRCLDVILHAGHEVVAVGTFSPATHESWDDAVHRLAVANEIPVLAEPRFRSASAVAELRDHTPDIVLVAGWRWILPAEVLDIAPLGTLGIHGSLLPRLRGFAPVNWALIRGERETGPTLFYFDEGCDTGDIVDQRPFLITPADDAATVRDRIADESVAMLRDNLPLLAAGTAPRRPQDDADATFGPQRRPDDGLIDWDSPTRAVVDWVRGLTRPYPGAFTVLDGERIAVWRVAEAPGAGRPGHFLGGPRPRIATTDGAVELLDVGDDAGALERLHTQLRTTGAFDRSFTGAST